MGDHNDWRVTISLADETQARQAKELFSERAVEEDVHHRLGRAIAVGSGATQVFLYAGTEIAAREAMRVASVVLSEHGLPAQLTLQRWHPVEEQWEDSEVALPQTDAEREAEHRKLLTDETAESLAIGVPQWEARVEFPTRHEAAAFASRLRAEGRPVVRRWRFLAVGATNEDEARELAAQIRREAPADATVRAEHSGVFLPFIPF